MKTIHNRLMNNKPISFRQLEVIIPYLQNDLKDTDHKSYSKTQIIELFSVCLYDHHHTTDEDYLFEYYPHIYDELYETKTPSTLEKFMV